MAASRAVAPIKPMSHLTPTRIGSREIPFDRKRSDSKREHRTADNCRESRLAAPRNKSGTISTKSRSLPCTSQRLSALFIEATEPAAGSRCEFVLPSDVRDHRRVSPLLRAPVLQNQPLVSVPARPPRLHRRSTGSALVGGQSSHPPPAAPIPKAIPILRCAGSAGLTRPGSSTSRPTRGHGSREGLGEISGTALVGSFAVGAPHLFVCALLRDRGLERIGLGRGGEYRAAVSRDISGQFALSRCGHAAVFNDRREQKQRGGRAPNDGRRLAQQPPPLPALSEPGVPLVGN